MTNQTSPSVLDVSQPSGVRRYTRVLKSPSFIVVVLLLIFARVLYPGFYEWTNISNILAQNAGLILVSVGMTYVIITGAFDLSVGAILGLGAIAYARVDGILIAVLAVVLCAVLGSAVGTANGVLVTRFRINPFVATLGTATITVGLATILAGQQALLVNSESFEWIGRTRLLGLTPSAWFALTVFIVGGIVLGKTVYGRNLYAIGGNSEAARISGIPVGVLRASVFVLVGCLSGLAGAALAAQVGTAQSNFGASMALDAIAVVVIGGTSLLGGEGSVWRTGIGIVILAVLNNIFQSLAFEPAIQQVIKGCIVLAAVGFDAWYVAKRQG